MEDETLGFSIGAETEGAEVCYVPAVRAISSVGRAPARQTFAPCFSEFGAVAPSGTFSASLSEESPESSQRASSAILSVFRNRVAFLLHETGRFDPQLGKLFPREVAS